MEMLSSRGVDLIKVTKLEPELVIKEDEEEIIVQNTDDESDDDQLSSINIGNYNTSSYLKNNLTTTRQLVPEKIEVEPELVVLEDDDDDDEDGNGYAENTNYHQHYKNEDMYTEADSDEMADSYRDISFDEIKKQHEKELLAQRNGFDEIDSDDDVILIEGDEKDPFENDDGDDEDDEDDEKNYFDNKNKPYACPLCSRTVATSYNLKRHMMIHTGEKPYGCDLCEKRFREFSDLKKHRKIHCNEEHFKCMVCYRNPPAPDNPTKCEDCERTEKTNKNLGVTIEVPSFSEVPRMENNKKAYICTYCDRIFGSSHNLKRHVMIHTGEKPYTCDNCNKSFRELSTLKKHQLTHLQPRFRHSISDDTTHLHHCNQCGKKFLNSINLTQHQQIAHNIIDNSFDDNLEGNESEEAFLSLRCYRCAKSFRSKQHLQSHMLTHD